MGSPSKVGAYRLNGVRCIAWVECDTGELHDGSGGLRTMYRPGLFSKKVDFEALGIYRVRVRENKTRPTDHMIVKVLGKASDPRLEAIRDEYMKPVSLLTELGTFELDRDFNEYQGVIDYLGNEISVSLSVEEGKTDAEGPLQRLRQICSDLEGFDAKVRQYIAKDETLWDWLDDGGYSREGFEQRLGAPSLAIDTDCEVGVWFDGGEPFGYHSVVVTVDKDDNCTFINLVG